MFNIYLDILKLHSNDLSYLIYMLLFAILSVTLASFTFDDGQCKCNQLVVETECKFNIQCTWDGVAKTCSRKSCADLKDQCAST